MVFWGAGVARTELPDGIGLDSIAPTVSEILGFERPFPRVRSGGQTPGVASGERPTLVLLIAWKGVGSAELETAGAVDRPFLSSLLDDGAGTRRADAGSIPLDPAATLTTIGTGGLPSQHGITGSFVRNDDGRVVEAFGPDAPVTVIATLADDFDHAEPTSLVGAVLTDDLDRGIVGDGWYPQGDPVDTVIGDGADGPDRGRGAARGGIRSRRDPRHPRGRPRGEHPRPRPVDSTGSSPTPSARRTAGRSSSSPAPALGRAAATAIPDEDLVAAVEDAIPGDARSVETAAPGGLFLDQDALRPERLTGLVAVEAMRSAEGAGGRPILSDAFQGFAVSFGRYC